jgi:hypothetical protein
MRLSKFDYMKTSKADATNRNLLTQLDHDMIFKIKSTMLSQPSDM